LNLPNIDVVVDCGLKIFHHNGRIQTLKTTMSDEIQRRGRVGRFKNGSYYNNLNSGCTEWVVEYPTPFQFLTHTEIQGFYSHFYGLTHHFNKFDAHKHNIFKNTIRVRVPIEIDESLFMTTAIVCLIIRSLHYNHNEFFEVYSELFNLGWTEKTEFIIMYIPAKYQEYRFVKILNPTQMLIYFDRRKSFTAIYKGNPSKFSFLKWQNNELMIV